MSLSLLLIAGVLGAYALATVVERTCCPRRTPLPVRRQRPRRGRAYLQVVSPSSAAGPQLWVDLLPDAAQMSADPVVRSEVIRGRHRAGQDRLLVVTAVRRPGQHRRELVKHLHVRAR